MPLCSTGITRLPRSYGPLRHLARPDLALAGCRLGVTRPHRRGFPCCVGSPCAGMPPPLPRWNPGACRVVRGGPLSAPGRRPSPCSNRVGFHIGLFRGLHGVHSRCGLPARRAAKAARCLEGFDGFVTSAAAPIATGWSDQLSGRESHPLKIRAFSRRTATHTPFA